MQSMSVSTKIGFDLSFDLSLFGEVYQGGSPAAAGKEQGHCLVLPGLSGFAMSTGG